MAAPRAERRLAAILAADVVGYSRLVERDEAGSLERLKSHRKAFIEPLIAEYRGRVVKLMGDGALCEFASVVDAVACAVAIQRGMAERERNVPEDERIQLRIGVNLGDVVLEEDGDLYGDGVNVAARLEQLAEPGGITLSGTAYDHLQGRLGCGLEFQPPERRWRSGARLVAPALGLGGQDLVHPLPDRPVDDRLVLAWVAPALVHGLAEIRAVAQELIQRALVERPPIAEGARLRRLGLGPVALGVQLPDQ